MKKVFKNNFIDLTAGVPPKLIVINGSDVALVLNYFNFSIYITKTKDRERNKKPICLPLEYGFNIIAALLETFG